MRARSAAVGSEPVADAAANEHLAAGGGALDAVLSGFFAAAGNDPGVLLGPISVLLGGVGQGARAFDGRVRQPGLGAKRPRGFAAGEPIPEAARIGAPTGLAAALVAHAYGSASLRTLVRPGIVLAERAGAAGRAELLERVAQVGASALSEASYRRGLLRVASPSEGGLLTPRDLDAPTDVDVSALERDWDGSRWVHAPWMTEPPPETPMEDRGAALAAIDVYGVLAALVYRTVTSGAWIEELQLLAPLLAVPVRRGVPRVSPGARLFAPAPMAIRLDGAQGPIELCVEPNSASLDLSAVRSPRWSVRRDAATRLVTTASP